MTEEATAPIAENVETTTGEDVKKEEETKPEETKPEETKPEETKPTEADKAAAKAEKKAAKVSYENRELRRQLKSNADQMKEVLDAIKKNTPQAKEPDIGNFEKLEEYLDARDKFVKQQETPNEPDKDQAEYQQYFTESRQEMIDNGTEKYDDFELVITDDKVKLSMAMCDSLFMIDDPELQADVAYYLGKNPKETLRIAKLPDQRQYAAIGKLEAKFEAKPAKKRISTAPAPVEPVGGGSTPSDEIRDQENIKDYIRKRNKQRGLS